MKQNPPDPVTLSSFVTREGWYWLFAAVTLLITGLFKGINLVTLLGCLMLVCWCLSWFSSRKRLRPLRGRRFLEEPIFAATPFTLEAELHNPRRAGAVGLVLHEERPEGPVRWFIPFLPGRATERYRQAICCNRRGRYPIGPLAVSTSLPFGLTRRHHLLAPQEEIIVLPRLGRLHRGRLRRHLVQVNLTLGRARVRPRHHPAAQDELHGLRSFRSGDSPRWIHWRTTARKGELMVREFEDMPTDNLILILDPCLSSPDADLEEAISLAATICWEWCRQTGDHLVLAVAGPEPIVLAGVTGRELARSMLRCLALQPPTQVSDGTALLQRLSGQELPPGPVLVVSAQPTQLEDVLREGLHRPVACVAVSDPEGCAFYERTAEHAS